MYTRTYARLLPRFFSILIGLFFTFWHPESAQVVEKMQNRRQFCQKNLFILFWPIIVCGRGSTSETHKEVRFLNGSEASGKLRYRDSQRPMRGKAHAGKTSYAYSYVRTCAHVHMGTCHVRTYMRQTTVPRRVTVSQRLVKTSCEGSRLVKTSCEGSREGSRGKTSYAYSYAYMRTCVYAYVRTHARTHARTYARTHVRTYARTHVRTHARTHARTYACAHVLHIWVRVWFFPSVSLSTHRSTSRDTVASLMSRGTTVYRLLPIHRLLLILFVRMSVRLTCAVTHVRTYEYAYWAFPAWTFPCIGLFLVFFGSLVNSSCHCFTAK